MKDGHLSLSGRDDEGVVNMRQAVAGSLLAKIDIGQCATGVGILDNDVSRHAGLVVVAEVVSSAGGILPE